MTNTATHLEHKRQTLSLLPTARNVEQAPYTRQRLSALQSSISHAQAEFSRLSNRLSTYSSVLDDLAGDESRRAVSRECEAMISEVLQEVQAALDRVSRLYPLRNALSGDIK